MAIRFVDVETDKADGAEPAPAGRSSAPEAVSVPAAVPDEAHAPEPIGADPGVGEAPLPGLTHAKPEPKPRGRKKPMSASGADGRKAQAESGGPSAPLLDGLLPELQAHAKPIPKPRGRKKAFG